MGGGSGGGGRGGRGGSGGGGVKARSELGGSKESYDKYSSLLRQYNKITSGNVGLSVTAAQAAKQAVLRPKIKAAKQKWEASRTPQEELFYSMR